MESSGNCGVPQFNRRRGRFCTFMAFVTANKLTTSANTIVLQYTAPIFIIIISAAFFKQSFKRMDYLTVGITILGIALCFFDQLSAGSLSGKWKIRPFPTFFSTRPVKYAPSMTVRADCITGFTNTL
jgi:drug/metabolite transporter (DMT)-like permease